VKVRRAPMSTKSTFATPASARQPRPELIVGEELEVREGEEREARRVRVAQQPLAVDDAEVVL
jgi:hypothetical protein